MILWILAYLGGLLTILSPCILPVLPFVLSRSDAPFRRSGLPLLAGMAIMFAGVATLAVVGGAWVVRANEWGRGGAIGLLSLFALSLLFPEVSEWMTRPFTRLGSSLQQSQSQERSMAASFVLGMATGLLWAPCAGPILGLILTSAALNGANTSTSVLLLMYALGAATSLALALLAGQKVYRALKHYLGADVWVRRSLGILVLFGIATIALGLDRGTLTRLSRVNTDRIEANLIGLFHDKSRDSAQTPLRRLPELSGATTWFNSAPLTRESLQGKVVLVDFWTYSCINCLRTLPYMKAWNEKYKDFGLVIIGVHTPEFAFEKSPANVEKALKELGVTYPVALDSDYKIWNAFQNQYWPAHYFIDAQGMIRHTHFGEGGYEESERLIQQLLAETPLKAVPAGLVHINADGTQAPGSEDVGSPETYIGSVRAQHQVPWGQPLQLNQWSLGGEWAIHPENAELMKSSGKIIFHFHSRDLHLVLGPGPHGKPVHFAVRIDGKSPGQHHGSDTSESGQGVVREQRLYQLIRQAGENEVQDHLFQIEFLDPGVQAFAFTFG